MVIISYSRIPHQVTLEKKSWCLKHLGFDRVVGVYDMIIGLAFYKNLHIDITNADMHYVYSDHLWPQFMVFAKNNITLNGHNYFSVNRGIIMQIVNSNLTISGNLTLLGAETQDKGGAIMLTQSSSVFLKEPLEARFYDNRATQGSAIYVEEDSRMYIQPNRLYSLKNITEIEIALYFRNNTNYLNAPNSLFVHESFSTLLLNTTPHKFLFRSDDWDFKHNRWAYDRVFDVILKEMDEIEKFTFLPNGICWQLHGKKKWHCTYTNKNNDLNNLTYFSTYPGEKAISISYSKYGDMFTVQQLSCSDNQYAFRDLDYVLHKNESSSTVSAVFQNLEDQEICIQIFCSKTKADPPGAFFEFYVQVNAYCPLGFHMSEKGYCNCTLALSNYGYECNIDTRIIKSLPNFWTGNSSNKTILFTRNCPPNHCDQKFCDFVPNDSITDLSCLNSRTGILCGECKENYSVVFGSEACYDNCTDLYVSPHSPNVCPSRTHSSGASLCIATHCGHRHHQWSHILCQHTGSINR